MRYSLDFLQQAAVDKGSTVNNRSQYNSGRQNSFPAVSQRGLTAVSQRRGLVRAYVFVTKEESVATGAIAVCLGVAE